MVKIQSLKKKMEPYRQEGLRCVKLAYWQLQRYFEII